jgi:glycosyltransferase involved in cell wall biosynthesis
MSKRGKAREKGKKKGPGAQIRSSKLETRNGDRGVVFARDGLPDSYWKACDLAREGRYDQARDAYLRLTRGFGSGTSSRLRALVQNDLAVLDAMEGNLDQACDGWQAVVDADQGCLPARLNFSLVRAEMTWSRAAAADATASPDLGGSSLKGEEGNSKHEIRNPNGPVRVAVLSFLFNWPSTGGGNMHTAGLVEFLGRDGFEVRHFFARYPAWRIGRADDGELAASQAIEFGDAEWNVETIRQRFRAAVDGFAPDYVVISDAWNMKPHLADAVRGYPTILLMQAQECLCPLNNLRLLGIGPVKAEQCPRNQLATPQVCHQCLSERGQHSGALHQVERALAGVGTAEYDGLMRRAFLEAEAVLVLNPVTAALVEPYARRVCVVPWGIDPARFPWAADGERMEEDTGVTSGTQEDFAGVRIVGEPGDLRSGEGRGQETRAQRENGSAKRVVTLFMAAVAGEVIKGFHVAHEACRILRETRSDFELVVTFDPAGPVDEFTRSVGWCSQDELPGHYRAADICLVPTIAQDALSITSVEAMAAGKAVIASRIGGLPYTVTDGLTGLLFEPGNPFDLAAKINRLLDDPELRHSMGQAGRRRFEEDFMWPDVIKRYWRPLLPCRASVR